MLGCQMKCISLQKKYTNVKRIKLFEAFSNENKIERLNNLLLYWTFETFIKERIENKQLSLYKSKDLICIRKNVTDEIAHVCYDIKKDSIIYNWEGEGGCWNFYSMLFNFISRRLEIDKETIKMSNLENAMIKFFKKNIPR
jgi:hypothetical protein